MHTVVQHSPLKADDQAHQINYAAHTHRDICPKPTTTTTTNATFTITHFTITITITIHQQMMMVNLFT